MPLQHTQRRQGVWTLLCALTVVSPPGMAAPSAAELEKLIADAKILSPECKVKATTSGEEVVISTYANTKAATANQDCKATAVSIAKQILARDAAGFKRAKIMFFDTAEAKKYLQVVIRDADIRALKSGQMSQNQLVEGIAVTPGMQPAGGSSDISPGPRMTTRKAIKARIALLESRRIGVTPLWQDFNKIEDLAREADGLSATDDQQKRNEIAGRMNDDIDRLFIRLLDTQQQVIDLAVKNANAARAAQAAAQAAQAATTITNNAAAAPPAEVVTNLGEFMPRIGPLLIDRLAIGEHLFKLKSQGINTSQYVSHFSEMEALARASDIPRLQIKLRELQNHLGLKPISDKERRETTIFK